MEEAAEEKSVRKQDDVKKKVLFILEGFFDAKTAITDC